MPVTAVHVLNEDVLPFFEERNAAITTILSDNGRKFWGRPDHHPYELFLQLEGIEHRTTNVGRPQSNGFVERLHRTLLDEHFRIMGRTHKGRNMKGWVPYNAFIDGLPKTEKPSKRLKNWQPDS